MTVGRVKMKGCCDYFHLTRGRADARLYLATYYSDNIRHRDRTDVKIIDCRVIFSLVHEDLLAASETKSRGVGTEELLCIEFYKSIHL